MDLDHPLPRVRPPMLGQTWESEMPRKRLIDRSQEHTE